MLPLGYRRSRGPRPLHGSGRLHAALFAIRGPVSGWSSRKQRTGVDGKREETRIIPAVRRVRVYGEEHEGLIDVERIDLDPVYDGFSGVVVELLREGDSYVVLQSAEVTGNRLLRFVTASEERALEVFEGEKGARDGG